jgi:hypothetical protein
LSVVATFAAVLMRLLKSDQRGAAMIRVRRIEITKEQFRTLPKDERALLLLMGHAMNQIAVLTKLVIFSTNKDPADPIEGRVSAAQSQVILRILTGTVAETWEFLRKPANQKIIGSYLHLLDKDGTASREELNKYFGGSHLLHDLRNKFSYHFPSPDEIERGFEAVPDDDNLPWEWYISDTNTNSFYFSSEMAMGFGAISQGQVQGESLIAAARKLTGEPVRVANRMQYYLMPLMRVILLKHFGPSILEDKPGTTITDAPPLYEFWIPFFAESLVQD